jgi:hypothetical protein
MKRARRVFVRTAASSFFRDLSRVLTVEAANLLMRCVYCSKRAGFLRRVCTPCAKVVAIVDRAGGEVGLAGLVDIFVAEGLTREQVDVVLDAQVGREPTIRESPEDVMKVRTAMRSGGGAGTWTGGEEPPDHH